MSQGNSSRISSVWPDWHTEPCQKSTEKQWIEYSIMAIPNLISSIARHVIYSELTYTNTTNGS